MLVRNKYVTKKTTTKDMRSLSGERYSFIPEYCCARIGALYAVANERHKCSPKVQIVHAVCACVCEFCKHQTHFSFTAQIVCVCLCVCVCARAYVRVRVCVRASLCVMVHVTERGENMAGVLADDTDSEEDDDKDSTSSRAVSRASSSRAASRASSSRAVSRVSSQSARIRNTKTPGGFRHTKTPGGFRDTKTPGGFRDTKTPGGFRDTKTPALSAGGGFCLFKPHWTKTASNVTMVLTVLVLVERLMLAGSALDACFATLHLARRSQSTRVYRRVS